MSGTRWIKLSVSLMLPYVAAVTGRYTVFTIREGADAMLPCSNPSNQSGCEQTSWSFPVVRGENSSHLQELLRHEWIDPNARAKSGRLSVTESCSLKIEKVRAEDGGRYICRQFEPGWRQAWDAHIDVNVVSMHEHQHDDLVTFSCSVSPYSWCRRRHSVTWLLNGQEVDEKAPEVELSHFRCSANLSFRKSAYNHTLHRLLTCQISGNRFAARAWEFAFSPERTDDAVDETQGLWRYIIVSLGLAVLVIIVLSVNIWTRSKEWKWLKQTKENIVGFSSSPVEDDRTTNYENLDASIRVH